METATDSTWTALKQQFLKLQPAVHTKINSAKSSVGRSSRGLKVPRTTNVKKNHLRIRWIPQRFVSVWSWEKVLLFLLSFDALFMRWVKKTYTCIYVYLYLFVCIYSGNQPWWCHKGQWCFPGVCAGKWKPTVFAGGCKHRAKRLVYS